MNDKKRCNAMVMAVVFMIAGTGWAASFSLSGPGQTGNTITVAPGASFTVTAQMTAPEAGNTFEVFLGYDVSNASGPGLTGSPTLNKLTLVGPLTNVANSINSSRFDVWRSAKAATAREANNADLGGRPYGMKVVGAGYANTAAGSLTLFSATFQNNLPAGQSAAIVISDAGAGTSYTTGWKSGTATNRGGYVLHVVSAANRKPGDANGDGKVDVSDLGILAANYGTTSGATWEKGDFNGDGKVDVSDLGILAANYGSGTGSSLDFNKDAQALGLIADTAKEESPAVSTLGCGSVGLPLVAILAGLFLFMLGSADGSSMGKK